MERHTIEICRAFCAGMKVLILDGIARDYTQKETEYMKRLVIRLKEKGISILWIDTRPEIMLDAADRLAVLRKGRLAAVLYREEFDRQMIDRIIIGENRKVGREIIRSQADPGGRGMLLSVREVRATELRDVSFHVCPGEVEMCIRDRSGGVHRTQHCMSQFPEILQYHDWNTAGGLHGHRGLCNDLCHLAGRNRPVRRLHGRNQRYGPGSVSYTHLKGW